MFTSVFGQKVEQWASVVVEVSSELTELEHSVRQVLGPPNVLPAGGSNENAWRPYRPNELHFLKVEFDMPMPIRQIAIGESFNPGSVAQIYGYDVAGIETLLYQGSAGPTRELSRMLNIYLEETAFSVKALKIFFDGRKVDGFSEIDCIGISNSTDPITAEINLMPNVNSRLQTYRMNDLVNSEAREIKPILTRDGQTLYFSRRGHPNNIGGLEDLEDIWYADFDPITQDWGQAKNIGRPLNNEYPNFISSFLQEDREYIILGNEYYADGRSMKYGISKSLRTGENSWTYPQNLEIYNEENVNLSVNFWLTRDEEVLIISKENIGSEGQRDLYVSFFQKEGQWTEPIHLGNMINTAGEEEGPFLLPDKRTLFFSSNGHSGFGGKDIFVTRRLDNSWKNWSKPENLGPLINTEVDDMFFFMPPNGSFGYFTREVEGNDLDIYSFSLPLVSRQLRLVSLCGTIEDPVTLEPLDAEVVYTRLRDGVEVGRVRTDANGNYCIELPADEIYAYRTEAPGYVPVGATIDLLDVEEKNVYAVALDRLDVDSTALEMGEPLAIPDDVLKAVTFEIEAPELKRDTMRVFNASRMEIGLPSIDLNAVIQGVSTPVIYNVNPPVIRVAAGASFAIRNVFFDFDKDLLKEQSWVEIRNLVNFMNDYPNAIVELAGHTDSYGTDEYNVDLSMRRVERVKRALIQLGIEEDRLRFVWYGETIPMATNRNPAGRALNRRVEFTILKLE